MRKLIARRSYIVCALAVMVIVVITSRLIVAGRQGSSASELKSAETAVADALIAMRDGDARRFQSLIYSRSESLKHHRRTLPMAKRIAGIALVWQLKDVSDDEIRRSVKAVPKVSRALMINILQLDMGRFDYDNVTWPTWNEDKPTAVTYSMHGVRMMSIALREGGKWKLSDFPLNVSADVINYRTLGEANANCKAAVDPP